MKKTLLSRFFLVAAAVVFPLASYGQEITFAKVNITVVNGTLTIDENDPSVAGLMFKFGSVVGVNSEGENGQAFDPKTDILFDPTSLAKTPYSQWRKVPYTKGSIIIHNHSNVLSGKGDPCRLVGLTNEQINSGEVDNRKWRLPTNKEQEWFVKECIDTLADGGHDYWVEKPVKGLLANDGAFYPHRAPAFTPTAR